ncbi:hypothetical protein N7470_006643 [Penicillium chermesinum]|nr:hypothetical protein N7470_006643 [Penicillium chermesinum]
MSVRTAPAAWDKQHTTSWRWWVPNLPKSLGANKCDRDEWPPAAFMEQKGSPYVQWIRFVPSSANRKAGQLWKGICGKPKKQTKWEGGPIRDGTCTTVKSVIYTLNAMSMYFKNVFSHPGLDDNPCLPIITDDPGFALFTQDACTIPFSSLTAGHKMPRGWWSKIAKRSDQEDEQRWVEMETEIFEALEEVAEGTYIPVQQMDFDPEKVIIDEGNSSRYATPQELWEELGLLKCRSYNCEKERAAVGHYEAEEIESQMAIPTDQDFPVQTPPPSASRWNPASGPSIPLGPRETGTTRTSSEGN